MADWADAKANNLLQNWQEADPGGCDREELRELICDYLRGTARQARINALEEAASLIEGWPDPDSQPSVVAAVESCAYAIRRQKDKQP